jgi:hypothetical protein
MENERMRSILAGLTVAAALGVTALPTSASPFGAAKVDRLGMAVEQVQYDRTRYCERLRRACRFKDERGESGEGNCRRYRRECRM